MPASKKPRKVSGSTKSVARTLAKPKVRSTTPVRLTPAESKKLDRIAQAHAARMAAEFKDVREVVQHFERVEPSLGGRETGRVPSGRDVVAKTGGSSERSGGAKDDRQLVMPSTDLASYMAGATSDDATVTKDAGVIEKRWNTRNDDGTTTVHTSAYNANEGSRTSTETTRSQNDTRAQRITDRRDGSSDGETVITDRRDRLIVRHSWERDARGNFVRDNFQYRDYRSGEERDYDRAAERRRGLVRLPSDDAGSPLGRRLGARFSHGATKPAPVVTQVNPGERDDSGSRAPRLNLGKKIVVNPGVEAGNQGREVGAARVKHWQRQLRDKVRGQVNPPRPKGGKS